LQILKVARLELTVVEEEGRAEWALEVVDCHVVVDIAPELMLVESVLSEGIFVGPSNVLGVLLVDVVYAVALRRPREHIVQAQWSMHTEVH